MNEGFTTSMFWAGALMAFTPIVFAATILGVWWYKRKKDRGSADASESSLTADS